LDFWSYIGIASVLVIAFTFIKRLGKTLPILELMLLIAGLQWIIGPIIEYASPSMHWKYYMYVKESVYMGFVVPAYMVFSGITLFYSKKARLFNLQLESLKHYSNYGIIILIIGIIFDLIGGVLPGALAFFGFVLSNFKFVGAIILFYSESSRLKKLFYYILIYLLGVSIYRALFHDFILWSTFFYMFWAVKHKPSVPTILVTILAGALFASTLQTIKAAYRTEIWNNNSDNKIELFVSLMIDGFLTEESDNPELDDGIDSNVRLNQGWIISAILDHIPTSREYFGGSTIKEAVFASLLPRILNPNKTTAGGKENFREFTGLNLTGASMGISIIGEAYGNFAKIGGIVFMGFWGFFLARVWIFLLKRVQYRPILIAFIPLMFLQVIKAETELVVVLNHLVKASIVVFLFLWGAKNVLKWKLSDG